MKKIIYTVFLVFSFLCVLHAQEPVDARIVEVYGDYTNEVVLNDPHLLTALNNLLHNRVKIVEESLSSDEKYIKLSQVQLLNTYNPNLTRDVGFDSETFNVLKYNLNFFSNSFSFVYRIDNTNYLIVIEPQSF